jgi:hypothetical protein
MKLIGYLSLFGLLAAGATPTLAQSADPGIQRLLHDGWYFSGSSRADAEARIAGANGTALVIDCQASTPRVTVFFRENPLPAGSAAKETRTQAVELTFHFRKRSAASSVTSYFDTEQTEEAFGDQISYGWDGAPASSEHVNVVGAEAMKLLALMKTTDQVSAGAAATGQPASFPLSGAAPAIDQVLAICAKGP